MKLKKILKRISLGFLIAVVVLLAALHIGVTVKYRDYYKKCRCGVYDPRPDGPFCSPGL